MRRRARRGVDRAAKASPPSCAARRRGSSSRLPGDLARMPRRSFGDSSAGSIWPGARASRRGRRRATASELDARPRDRRAIPAWAAALSDGANCGLATTIIGGRRRHRAGCATCRARRVEIGLPGRASRRLRQELRDLRDAVRQCGEFPGRAAPARQRPADPLSGSLSRWTMRSCRAGAGAGRHAVSAAGPRRRDGARLRRPGRSPPSRCRRASVRRDYRLRGEHGARSRRRSSRDFRRVRGRAVPAGRRAAAARRRDQLHLAIGPARGFVHADAGCGEWSKRRASRRGRSLGRLSPPRSRTRRRAEHGDLVLTTVGTALGGPIGGALGSLSARRSTSSCSGRRRARAAAWRPRVQTSTYGTPDPAHLRDDAGRRHGHLGDRPQEERASQSRRQGPAGDDGL